MQAIKACSVTYSNEACILKLKKKAQCIVGCDYVQFTPKIDVTYPVILIICTDMHCAKSNLQTNMFAAVTIGLSVLYQDHDVVRKAIRQPFDAQIYVQCQVGVDGMSGG